VAVVLLTVGFVAILAGARLFTNAVEWAGHRLSLGEGAVGGLLAAVSTALPESIIPIVAIVKGDPHAEEVAVGAIIGAPFMLATLALAIVGVSAFLFSSRREQGRTLTAHRPTVRRDLGFFVGLLAAALALGAIGPGALGLAAAALFLAAYAVYVRRSLAHGGDVQDVDELEALAADPTKHDPPSNWMIGAQFIGSLALIIGGAHVFVDELLALAEQLDASPLVLALLLAPLATELPEKANSVLWIRDGKDTLALGNVTGAMVFQSTVPVAIGLAVTSWDLEAHALLAGTLALAGGLVAVWTLHVRRRFDVLPIAAWTLLFFVFVGALAV
jgi:cation:H+ antiporter